MSSDAVMAWLAAGSLLVALVAVFVAIGARRDATTANTAATQANSISRTANTHAEDANKIAVASNGIAKSAFEYARNVPTDLAWDQVLVALSAIQTADVVGPESKDTRIGIKDARTAILLLNDRIGTTEFADWTFREMQHGMLLAYEANAVGSALKAKVDTGEFFDINEIMALNHPFQSWVAAFIINLRILRRDGLDANTLGDLAKTAKDGATGIADEHGLDAPSDSIPGLSPLYPEQSE